MFSLDVRFYVYVLLNQIENHMELFHDQSAIRCPQVKEMATVDGIDLGVNAYPVKYCLSVINMSA